MPVKFLIVSTGYNCASLAEKCLRGIASQTYKNFTAILIDDGSTDNTKEILQQMKNEDDRIRIYISKNNRGAALRRWQAINELANINDQVVVVLVGMDDELKPNALQRIAQEYDKGAWMTYGNWIDSDGKMLPPGFLEFSEQIHKDRSYRKHRYRSTGPNTFKKFLFDQLTENDFIVKGKWIRATTESNLMFSCLEMCGKDRIGIIEDPIVLYNRRDDNTVAREGRTYQNAVYNEIIKRPKKPLLRR